MYICSPRHFHLAVPITQHMTTSETTIACRTYLYIRVCRRMTWHQVNGVSLLLSIGRSQSDERSPGGLEERSQVLDLCEKDE